MIQARHRRTALQWPTSGAPGRLVVAGVALGPGGEAFGGGEPAHVTAFSAMITSAPGRQKHLQRATGCIRLPGAHRRCTESLTGTYAQYFARVQVSVCDRGAGSSALWGRWGQEGLTFETGVAVTLLSHRAHHPSFRATWCFPERGSPMTIVGYAFGVLPDTQ